MNTKVGESKPTMPSEKEGTNILDSHELKKT